MGPLLPLPAVVLHPQRARLPEQGVGGGGRRVQKAVASGERCCLRHGAGPGIRLHGERAELPLDGTLPPGGRAESGLGSSSSTCSGWALARRGLLHVAALPALAQALGPDAAGGRHPGCKAAGCPAWPPRPTPCSRATAYGEPL